jgi:hypothetical protein
VEGKQRAIPLEGSSGPGVPHLLVCAITASPAMDTSSHTLSDVVQNLSPVQPARIVFGCGGGVAERVYRTRRVLHLTRWWISGPQGVRRLKALSVCARA